MKIEILGGISWVSVYLFINKCCHVNAYGLNGATEFQTGINSIGFVLVYIVCRIIRLSYAVVHD